MTQTTTGIRSVLSVPWVYDAFQGLMGARRIRQWFVAEHIRPASGMRILDLGCGTADILAFLPDDVSYNGYDISPDYIARARSRFAGRGDFAARMPTPEEARTLAPFDVVMGIGVLHHMDDEAAADFFALARSVLKPGGRVVTLDPCYAPGQHPLARFLIRHDRGRNVRDAAGYRALAGKLFPRVTGTLRHSAWVPYTHWVMESGL